MKRSQDAGIVLLVSVFDAAQCAALIALTESEGASPRGGGSDEPPAFARYEAGQRLPEFVWPQLAAALAAGLRPCQLVQGPVIDRFDAGQRALPAPALGPEADDSPPPGAPPEGGEWARLAVVVLLNDDFAGGETVCYPAAGPQFVALRAGAGLAVPPYLTCEDLPVRAGRKYVLRAGVLCRR